MNFKFKLNIAGRFNNFYLSQQNEKAWRRRSRRLTRPDRKLAHEEREKQKLLDSTNRADSVLNTESSTASNQPVQNGFSHEPYQATLNPRRMNSYLQSPKSQITDTSSQNWQNGRRPSVRANNFNIGNASTIHSDSLISPSQV